MNTSTQAMNNVNKVQQTNASNKASADKKSTELQFEALFSSAMGQIAPNAQLNNIEAQLRETLFKQDKDTKKKENSNPNAEMAQADVWAQRSWMQNTAMPAAAPTNNKQFAETRAAAVASKPAEKPAEKQVEKQTENPVKSQPGGQAETQSQKLTEKSAEKANSKTEQQAESTAETAAETTATAAATVPGAAIKQEAAAEATAKTVQPNTTTNTKPGDSENLNNATTAAKSAEAGKASELPAELNTSDQKQTADTTRTFDKSSGNAKVDTVLNNSTVSSRADTAATAAAGTPATFTNANAVAAQLAPQIARQAQNTGEALELEGLKPGQKIAAGSTLQGNTALVAGTNGLGNPLGTAQQALIKTPVNQPGFAKEVGQTVQWAIGKNLSTVDIRVNPETFGPMNMRLVQKGQQVQLVIRTQDEASANLLTQALSGLKEVMAQNGLQLNQVQIQHGNTPNGQANNGQPQFEQGNGQNRNGQQSGQGNHTAQQDTGMPAAPVSSKKPEGTLDLFA